MFHKGDRLIHIQSHKKCTFLEYELENHTASDDCARVIFDKIRFKKNVEMLIYIGNLRKVEGVTNNEKDK